MWQTLNYSYAHFVEEETGSGELSNVKAGWDFNTSLVES